MKGVGMPAAQANSPRGRSSPLVSIWGRLSSSWNTRSLAPRAWRWLDNAGRGFILYRRGGRDLDRWQAWRVAGQHAWHPHPQPPVGPALRSCSASRPPKDRTATKTLRKVFVPAEAAAAEAPSHLLRQPAGVHLHHLGKDGHEGAGVGSHEHRIHHKCREAPRRHSAVEHQARPKPQDHHDGACRMGGVGGLATWAISGERTSRGASGRRPSVGPIPCS